MVAIAGCGWISMPKITRFWLIYGWAFVLGIALFAYYGIVK
jgi:hypothetical protein